MSRKRITLWPGRAAQRAIVSVVYAVLFVYAFAHSNGTRADELVDSVAGWDIHTWIGDSGTVEGCSAEAAQPNQVVLTYYYGPAFGHELYFYDPSWAFKQGDIFPVQILIDQFEIWDAELTAVSSNTVFVPLNDLFVSEFQTGRTMSVIASIETLVFPLSGTSRAVDAAIDCARMRASQPATPNANPGTGNGTNNPFGGTQNPFPSDKGGSTPGGGTDKSSGTGTGQSAALSEPFTETEIAQVLDILVDVVLSHDAFSEMERLPSHEAQGILDADYPYRWTDGDSVFGGALVTPEHPDAQVEHLIRSTKENCIGGQTDVTRDTIEISQEGGYLVDVEIACQASSGRWQTNYSVIPLSRYTIVFSHASVATPVAERYNDSVIDAVVTWLYE